LKTLQIANESAHAISTVSMTFPQAMGQGPVKVFVLQLRLLSFGVGMGNVRAGSGGEVQWSML
jgi:hypothetical protein